MIKRHNGSKTKEIDVMVKNIKLKLKVFQFQMLCLLKKKIPNVLTYKF